ncbi:MAG: Holliday junction resolvase RuvX [Bacteroidota bacterium]|jgi:putative Holliday junction resolvase
MEMTTAYQRVLGVDYGSERIGLSLSDPLGIIAQPIEALKNDSSLFVHLQQLFTQENVKLIVVGMPLNLKGQHAQKADEVRKFIELLKAKLDIEVVAWDERFTTTIAHQTMLAMGTKKKERQKKDGRIDSMAAAIILQGFLDNTKHSQSC